MALVVFLNFFVVTLLTGIALTYRWAQKEDRAFSSCLAKVWQGQNNEKKLLEKLLALNPVVASLRAAQKSAKLATAAATASSNPAAIAAAQVYSGYVNAQILVVHQQQQALLLGAQIIGHEFNATAKYAIAKNTDAKKIIIDDLGLAVEADPPKEMMPFYNVKDHFEDQQRAGGHWQIKNLRGSCYATLENRGGRWFVKMHEDKF